MRNGTIGILLAGGILGAAGGGSAAAGRQTLPSPEALDALVSEVRGLRIAVEQLAAAGPRVDLALGRLQLQEQRVNNLIRRHTEVRERLAGAEHGTEVVARDIERLQDVLRDSADEEVRRAAQHEVRQLKDRHAQMNVDLQRLRTEEADVAQLLSLEQGRWTEINQQLEELERGLTRK